MKIRLSQLEAFVAVVEQGGITAAADHRNWSKSKVSKLLAELEDLLDVRLFYRSTRGLRPTSEGQSFYLSTRRNLDALESSLSELSDSRSSLNGHLRVAAPLIFTHSVLNPAVQVLSEENVTLDVALSDDRSDLDEREHDVYIRIGELEDGDYYAKQIGQTELMLVASPEYLERYSGDFHREDLLEADLLRYAQRGHAMPWRYADGELELNPRAKLASNNGEYLAEAAASGMGLTYLPDFLAAPHVAEGRLVRVNLDVEPLFVPINLLYFERARQSAALKRFIEVVTSQVAEVCPKGCQQGMPLLEMA